MDNISEVTITSTEGITYLADGVYASFDGYQIKLMTDNHITPTNTIYLNEDVLDALYTYINQINKGNGG